MRTTRLVQTFVLKRKRLSPGEQIQAPTASGALKRAEAMAGRTPGTAALSIATILGESGEVPNDLAESLQG